MTKQELLNWMRANGKKIKIQPNATTEDVKPVGNYTSSDEVQKILSELWDAGVNMGGEYQGVWVRYKDIEDIFNKHIRADAPVDAQN